VYARISGLLYRLPGVIHGIGVGMGQGADSSLLYLLGDQADRLEVPGRSDGKTCLDYIDAEPLQLTGDLQLLLKVKCSPRRLFAITQRGIEYDHPVHLLVFFAFFIHIRSTTTGYPYDLCVHPILPIANGIGQSIYP
jgi:hypothetical protein